MSEPKVAILIPSTSHGRDNWKTWKDSYLYTVTIRSFLQTYDKDLYKYRFFIGIDKGDRIYDTHICRDELSRFLSVMKNVEIEFMYMNDVNKGHLTVMWNKLYDKSLNDNYDYFVQCGDDIEFKTKGWMKDAITSLQSTNDIGAVGPLNNNPRILTQTIVSRKHKELFGYYFPPEILNWFCDDWINEVYKELKYFYPMKNHFCINMGGKPRYTVNGGDSNMKVRQLCTELVKRDVERARLII
tara:strand:- start:538 stop:1263 length:726 start_codon:yes stop_codon:yes gene_type:complete